MTSDDMFGLAQFIAATFAIALLAIAIIGLLLK